MRHALISGNTVVNVVLADPGFDHGPGLIAVASDTANIGDSYSSAGGGKFTSNQPSPTQTELISYAQLKQQTVLSLGKTVKFDDKSEVYASTDINSLTMLNSAVLYGQLNPSATINWVNHGGIIPLNAAEVNELACAVLGFVQSAYTTYGAVVAGINSGAITKDAQIDAASWPVGG